MPSVSDKQAVAMRLAAAGKSSIGIPKSVGQEFVAADTSQKRPSKTHRGRRSRGASNKAMNLGFSPEPASVAPPTNHHQDAKGHMENAQAAKSPNIAFKHLMKAVQSMHKARTQ